MFEQQVIEKFPKESGEIRARRSRSGVQDLLFSVEVLLVREIEHVLLPAKGQVLRISLFSGLSVEGMV